MCFEILNSYGTTLVGAKLQLVQESSQLSDQLYVVSGRVGNLAAMGLFPLNRRITIEKVLVEEEDGVSETQPSTRIAAEEFEGEDSLLVKSGPKIAEERQVGANTLSITYVQK
jgi:hypothetical protein